MSDYEGGGNGVHMDLEDFMANDHEAHDKPDFQDDYQFDNHSHDGKGEDFAAFFDNDESKAAGGKNKKVNKKKIKEQPTKNKYDISEDLKGSAHHKVREVIERKQQDELQIEERIEKSKNKEETIKAFVISSTLIMRNPYHYQNYIKLYILGLIARAQKASRQASFDSLVALVISKMAYEDVRALDALREGLQARIEAQRKAFRQGNMTRKPDEGEFEQDVMLVCRALLKYYCFKKFNHSSILGNFSRHSGSHTYEQIIQIFVALCRYVGIKARIVYLLDLRALNLDKKHKIIVSGLTHTGKGKKGKKKNGKPEDPKKELTEAQKKRKRDKKIKSFDNDMETLQQEEEHIQEDVIEEIDSSAKHPRKKMKISKKNLDSMIEKASSMIIEDHMAVVDDAVEAGVFRKGQDSEERFIFDSKLSGFKFDNPKTKIRNSDPNPKSLSRNNSGMVEEPENRDFKLNQSFSYFTQGSQKVTDAEIDSFTFSKAQKRPEKDFRKFATHAYFNTELKSDDHDSTVYKYWVEVFDEEKMKWSHVDPLTKTVFKGNEDIDKKLSNMPGLFIVSFMRYDLSEAYENWRLHRHHELYLKDLTVRYIPRWHKVLLSRKQIGIDRWWSQISQYFKFESQISDIRGRILNSIEDQELEAICKKDIPQHIREFRISKHYILPSLLRKYQGFKQEAVALPLQFKEENIFSRDSIEELKSRSRWMRLGRKVRKGETAMKRVVSMTSNEEKIVDLYGEWQTDIWENTLQEDGSLPKNDYGNYEMWHKEIPPGTAYIQELPGLVRLCKKLEVEYVECVIGFETSKGGKSHPVMGGVLVHTRDEERVREAYDKHKEELIKKEQEKQRKTAITLWKQVFKKILVKKYVEATYMNH